MKEKKYNILYIETGSGYGGSAYMLYRIVKYLNKIHFQPYVATAGLGSAIQKIQEINIPVIKLPYICLNPKKSKIGRNLKFFIEFFYNNTLNFIKLYRFTKFNNIKLIHLNNGLLENLFGALVARLIKIPCVCHVRGTEKLTRIDLCFSSCVNLFIVINKILLNHYLKYFDKNKVTLIYDSVNLENFVSLKKRILKEEYNLNDDCKLIGLIGRIVPGKGFRVFIKAANIVLKQYPNCRFFIVGDIKGGTQEYLNDLYFLVNKYNLKRHIIFTGWRSDISAVISDFDIMVQATTTFPEGTSLTIMEAMALKKPIIATDVPGSNELVIDGECGFIVPPGDEFRLADRILYLINNPSIARDLGENGRKRVEKFFSISKNIKKIENIYYNLLA